MRYHAIAAGLLALAFLATEANGQEFFVQASRTAIVRDDTNADADELLRLERGHQLNAVTGQQTDSFYNVFLPDGRTGWVSRFVVRLHAGRAPNAPPVAVMLDVGGGLTEAERAFASFHLAIGKPKGHKELIREGYVVGYDPQLKIPLWVQYRLTKQRSEDNTFPRTDAFDEDAAIPPQARATLDDYEGSGYARGHMAPAEDMRWSESAEAESNLLTNIAPQVGPTFNGSVWKTIENRVRGWVKDRNDLTIICGPVFEARDAQVEITRQPDTNRQMVYNIIGGNDVAVASAFFKIVIDMRDMENPNVLGFLVTHFETETPAERDIETYLTSIDDIELATGLDFLTNLPETVQTAIESVTPTAAW